MTTKLSTRLRMMVATTAAGFLIFSGYAFYVLQQLKVNGPLYDRVILGKDLIADILPPPEYIIEPYLVSLQLVQANDPGTINRLIARFRDLKKEYDTRHKFWLEVREQLDPKLREVYLTGAHNPAEQFFKIAESSFFPALGTTDKTQVVAILGQLSEEYEKHRKAIDQVVELANKGNAQTETDAHNMIAQSQFMFAVILLLALGSVIVLSMLTQRRVIQMLGGEPADAVEIVHRIADGDLSASINVLSGHEHSMLAALEKMQNSLRQMIERVIANSDQVAAAAEELSAVTDHAKGGLKAQYSRIDQVATAVNELASTVAEVATTSTNSATASQQAYDGAIAGRHVIAQVLGAIDSVVQEIDNAAVALAALEKDNANIGAVVDVITGVAEQTNLLALNAAIEAARAGEQGRGFAVVADEVRTLASRTQTSTKEIQQMVQRLQLGAKQAVEVMQRGQNDVRTFVTQACTATESIEKIVTVVHSIDEMNTQVAKAMDEQRVVTSKINSHVMELSKSAQETANGAQHTALASGKLARTAAALKEAVGNFRL